MDITDCFISNHLSEMLKQVDACRKQVNNSKDPADLKGWVCWDKEIRPIVLDLVARISELCRSDPQSERSKTLIVCLDRFLSVVNLLAAGSKKNYECEALKQMKQFISKIVNSILANIELAATACDPFTGTFLESMDFALPLIGEINVAQGSDNMLSNYNAANPSVEEVLCIAMSVAQVALGEDPNIIRGSCCSVIEAMLKLKEEITKEPPNPAMCSLVVDVAIDTLCVLERKVNVAVLRLCISVFSCDDDPFVALSNHLETDAEFANEFDLYFDRLNQICMFSIACSSESCVSIRSAMANLSFFENEYPPVFKVCFETKSNYMLEFVEFLKDFWKEEVGKVVESVYKIVEPSTYCEAVIEILRSKISEMSRNKSSLERCNTSSVVLIADELSRMLDLNISSFATDVQVKDFRIAKHEFKSAVECYFENRERCSSDQVLKRFKILMTTIKRIGDALTDCNQTTASVKANIENVNTAATNDQCLTTMDHKNKSKEILHKLTTTSSKPFDKNTQNESFYENKTSFLQMSLAEKRNGSFWYKSSFATQPKTLQD